MNLADTFLKYVRTNYRSMQFDQMRLESKQLLLLLIEFFDCLLALKYSPAWLLENIMIPQRNGLSLIHVMV